MTDDSATGRFGDRKVGRFGDRIKFGAFVNIQKFEIPYPLKEDPKHRGVKTHRKFRSTVTGLGPVISGYRLLYTTIFTGVS